MSSVLADMPKGPLDGESMSDSKESEGEPRLGSPSHDPDGGAARGGRKRAEKCQTITTYTKIYNTRHGGT